ncbi:glutathione S-transferase family protein [Maricaulis salignorans]|uniref:Glutathione S-transferase n=1 Tax=Maricaulis salignorans TaxID=144026 RepID=A0A1G9VPV7_9PROT|nr:glutathione S-transferase family protein [Maricaulis salignorans]SDM74103.1 glutathione S-transferase [Maricaulis salignorans]
MKFYDYKAAPSPRRARMFIAEKGLDIETIQVDLGAKAQFDPAYRAVNPRCTVPALALDDGVVLCDNASIARYLEEICPEPPLLGRDPVEKALVAEWLGRVEWEGFMGVAEALRNTSDFFKDSAIPGPQRYEQIPALAQRGRQRAEAFIAVMDQRLAEANYLAGDAFSAADIAGYAFVDFAAWVKLKPGPELEHLANWREAISKRPSASA